MKKAAAILILVALANGTGTAPPKNFVVHGEIWTLKMGEPKGSLEALVGFRAIGATSFWTRTVYVGAGQSCQTQQEVVLHELVHIAANHGTDDTKDTIDGWLEESGKDHDPVDKNLAEIARNNPELWKWIGEGCR